MSDTPTTAAEMREAAAQEAETATYAQVSLCCNGHECGCEGASVGQYVASLIRAIPLPSDGPVAVPGERIDYTAEQLRAMGERYAEAVAAIPSDDEMVEKVARAICATHGDDPERMTYTTTEPGVIEPYGPAWTRYLPDARAAIAAMRGE